MTAVAAGIVLTGGFAVAGTALTGATTLGSPGGCSITITPGDHSFCAESTDTVTAVIDCGPGFVPVRGPEWFLDGVPIGYGKGLRYSAAEGGHTLSASCGVCSDTIVVTVLPVDDCQFVPNLTAAFSDTATEGTTGIFQQANIAAITPSNFGELRFNMRPLTLTGIPVTLAGNYVLDQTGTNLEVFLNDGTPIALPDTIGVGEIPLSFLVNATGPGTSTLVATFDTASDSVKVRVGPFPGLAGKSLALYPHFEYMRSVNDSSQLRTAIDPTRHDERIGLPYRVYVVAHRTPAEWAADNTLVDVTGVIDPAVLMAGSIAGNIITPWSAPLNGGPAGTVGRAFDVIYDFGLNGRLDPGDLIDGLSYDEAGVYVMRSLLVPGNHSVTEILYSGGSSLGQDAYYPSDIASMGQLPLVMISHGAGHHHGWYDYLGTHLASYGYVVVSHETNAIPGPESASQSTLMNTEYFLANLGSIGGGVFAGHIDAHRISWIGHGRGGEGVARAYDRIADGGFTPSNFTDDDIVFISGIAPSVYLPVTSSNPHDRNYHLLWGMADGDICGCVSGCGNTCRSWRISEHAQGTVSTIGVQAAGHNDFNCCGTLDGMGPWLVGRYEAQKVARSYYLALLEWFVRGNVATKDFLTHMYDDLKPTGLLPSAVVYLTYTEGSAGTQVIDDYETNPSPGISSSGGAVTFDVSNLTESTLNGNSNYCPDDFMNGMLMMGTGDPSQSGVAFDWAPGDQKFYQWNVVPGARDFSARGFLSLKVSQGTRHPRTVVLDGPCYFTIELRDTAGHTSAIRTEAYGGVTSPFPRTGDCTTGGSGWANEQHTIRVRLADFENDNSQLDLANIAAVTLRFGSAWGSDRGRLVLDHLDLPQE